MWLFVKLFSIIKNSLVYFILGILNIFRINKGDDKLKINKSILFAICVQISLIIISILFNRCFTIWTSIIFNLIVTIIVFINEHDKECYSRYDKEYLNFRFLSLFLTVVAIINLFTHIEAHEAETIDYKNGQVENISCKTEKYRDSSNGSVYENYECKFKFKHANTSYEVIKNFNEIEFYKDGDDINIRIDR